jgi:hypothetical protein
MTPKDHEDFATDLLFSLQGDSPETEALNFVPNPMQSRNAAKAMAAILCHRLFKNSKHRPIHKIGTTYEWKQGVFNCRNIADRGYLWTNMRRAVANEMHEAAKGKPVAYLLACCEPASKEMNTWAIPEPLLYDSLTSLPFEEAAKKYTVEIWTDKQRIERYTACPDLTPCYRLFYLEQEEMLLLEESREVDASVKRERAIARAEEGIDDDDSDENVQAETRKLLATAEQHLNEAGAFDPNGVADARERVLSSIVRRRGQPAFRQHLLAAYNGRCAITGCNVAAVLEAAHIISYSGPDTNHPANGLLLRTDLHTLFDLKLVAVDEETMTLLVSPELSTTEYDEYRGARITVPDNRESRPSLEALRRHRQESGL